MCVRNGNRPAEDLIAEDIPREMVDLMKRCWDQDPKQRPTFEGMPLLDFQCQKYIIVILK